MWLDAHGLGNIVDDTTDRKKDQYDLIDILGSENYRDSIDGTGAFGLTRGLNRYLNERGYNVTFRSEGWRNVPDYVNVVATKPQVPWIKEAVTGANSGCLLNVGWYEYYNNNNTYIRKGGHWITVVGYGIDEDGGYCPDCIIIHDPAPRAGTDFRNQYTTFEEIQSGTIVHDNTRENARGYYIVRGMVNKDGYMAIPDSTVEFRIPKCCHELDFYGTYEMVHDGNWGRILTLQHNPYFDNDAVCDNIAGTYKALWNNEIYDVYGYTLKTTKGDNFCWYAGFWLHGTDCEVTSTPSGPKAVCSNLTDEEAANKIIFYVNFSEGRQRFDGYLFTWTKNAIAGITWRNNKPFGFYAIKQMPDLVITDVWTSNNNTIYYKIKNQGSANAGVSYTSLSVDGAFKASDYVAPLGAGAERTESFDYKWMCTPLSDTIKVCADYRGNVAESNEANNCITETWTCTELPRQLDIYFADAGESPGSVYHYNTTTGTEETVYTRPSQNLYSFSFHPAIPEKLYYVNANEYKIYRTLQTPSGWTPEEVVYTHTTYVRDIAFAFDKDGELRLYFSEATGAGGNGKIYKIEDGKASLYYEVKLADVGGFWAGDFAFDDKGNLYLRSGHDIPASISKVEEGKVKEIFKDEKECISGLLYADGALYYANWGTKIYRLDISTKERTVVYSNTKRTGLSDVDFRPGGTG